MSDGSGQLQVPAGSLLIVDPHSRVLRQMPHIEAYRQWMKQQPAAHSGRK
jgi:hypothetical protein